MNLSSLNPEQKLCVQSLDGPLLLIAGAGTGKTNAITHRIAYMIEQGIPPQRILALTFTNKAAREMQERIAHLCKLPPGRKAPFFVKTCTFHRFCLDVIRKYRKHLGFTTPFRLLAQKDATQFVKRTLEECHISMDADVLQFLISYCKNQLMGPQHTERIHMDPVIGEYGPQRFADLYQTYCGLLKVFNSIDFDDCIFLYHKLVDQNPEISKAVQESFDYITVDEFQDTNPAQLKIVQHLSEGHRNVCVVGDDDQSIYSWRGAVSHIFEQFEKLFPERKIIKLEQNYRSYQYILDASNAVIEHNLKRKKKTLWSSKTSDHKIILRAFDTEDLEAEWAVDKISSLQSKGVKFKQIAILYRKNNKARSLEVHFREKGIPYKVFGGQSLFERKEAKLLLDYLFFFACPHHDFSFLNVLQQPPKGFGLKTLESIRNFSKVSSSLYKNFEAMSLTKPEWIDLNKDLRDFIHSAKGIQSGQDLLAFCQKMIETFQFRLELRRHASSDLIFVRRMEWLKRIATIISSNFREGESLYHYISKLTLDPSDLREKDAEGNYVSLMTVHAAKGLEFDHVFICGLEDGTFPHKKNAHVLDKINEERRLFYVALTRARQQLYLSRSTTALVNRKKITLKPSRFLNEIPPDLFDTSAEEKNPERTRGRLSSLRQQLKEAPP